MTAIVRKVYRAFGASFCKLSRDSVFGSFLDTDHSVASPFEYRGKDYMKKNWKKVICGAGRKIVFCLWQSQLSLRWWSKKKVRPMTETPTVSRRNCRVFRFGKKKQKKDEWRHWGVQNNENSTELLLVVRLAGFVKKMCSTQRHRRKKNLLSVKAADRVTGNESKWNFVGKNRFD